ncbi:MAG TPA: L,D-transpeptidase [Xanthobacteraceae bacterium]|nr:L,D-transpeptidase [Xanthobacteraceae bacterium]
MQRHVITAFVFSMTIIGSAHAEPPSFAAQGYAGYPSTPTYIAPQASLDGSRAAPPARYAARGNSNLGGGFIEFLFNGGPDAAAPRPPSDVMPSGAMARGEPETVQPEIEGNPSRQIDPKFMKQVVAYHGPGKPGTIVIDTPQRFLYLVQDNGTALRYGIGVGKPGFTWAGQKTISAKKEWPDWVPPPEMLQRRPDLPHFMAGGPENPLGARALYLGSSLYRIHGSNEPWTIGQAVSSGCIRMRNEDVIDLYQRVKVGTIVTVI